MEKWATRMEVLRLCIACSAVGFVIGARVFS